MDIKTAIKTIKENATAKFDETIEVHYNLNIDATKADQMVRFVTSLPHGTGQSKKVAVLSTKEVKNADLELKESDIAKLENGKLSAGKDFDVLVVEPMFMPKIAKAARVLGPAGVMPNPKNGTVTGDVEKAVDNIKKGQIELKNEKDTPLMHTIIGKKSFEDKKLIENFESLSRALKQNKPQKAPVDWIKDIFICSTMGKSVKIDLE